jgi:cellulose synthase/poly-beta-1,6-N-acetylglucosamine synthase-like glycosyltransferase
MEIFVSSLLVLCAALIGILTIVFFLEVVAAIALPYRDRARNNSIDRPSRVAMLVPAHNESTGLLPTIGDIRGQLRQGDRLLVVADNCSDDTASIATAAGAEVAKRDDPAKRGKGYALEFGIRHLAENPPDVVIVVDADCRLAEKAIDQLAITCAVTRRPVQALYLMTSPNASKLNYQVAEFAWRVKNWLRPLGLNVLHLPCQLVGSGMAFPWDVICQIDLASGWLVEDVKLGLDLAAAGSPPVFCPEARVTSQFASSATGAGTQRRRWEQGHIKTILTLLPQMFWGAVARRNLGLLALTLDLAVPPLSLLALLAVGMCMLAGLIALTGGSSAALVISALTLLVFMLASFLAWLKCGRDILPPAAILLIAPYVLQKLSLYRHILSDREQSHWKRTDRTQ